MSSDSMQRKLHKVYESTQGVGVMVLARGMAAPNAVLMERAEDRGL